MRHLLMVTGLVLGVSTSIIAQQEIKAGDVVTITRSSVFIYGSPGGPADGEVTRQDLRSNGDVIVVQDSRTHRGEVWYRVKITAGKQEGLRFKMPDTIGWLRARDVAKAQSRQPYGAPPTWLQRLRTTIGVFGVIDSSPFVIYLKPGFWDSFDRQERLTIAKGHVDGVWSNRPKVSSVLIKEGERILAESAAPGVVHLR